MNVSSLPASRDVSTSSTLSLLIALLMAAMALAGLLFPSAIYPTAQLRKSFVPNDMVNLFVGLPTLLGSMALARRGKLIGLLFWPGALFYVTYNSIAYAIAMPLPLPFVLNLVLGALSVYTLFRLLSRMDCTAIQGRLKGAVPERFAGGVLIGFGGLFFVRAVSQMISGLTGQDSFAGPELAVLVADLVITPAWVIGGVMLWRHQAFGYVTGTGLLFQASMLFIALLAFFIFQPFLAAVPFPVEDFVAVLIMGLICFVPFALFVRGVLSSY